VPFSYPSVPDCSPRTGAYARSASSFTIRRMETSDHETGSIFDFLKVVRAKQPEYSSWTRDIEVSTISDDGQSKTENITLCYSDWDGYSVDYEGDNDDLAEFLADLSGVEMDELEQAALNVDGPDHRAS